MARRCNHVGDLPVAHLRQRVQPALRDEDLAALEHFVQVVVDMRTQSLLSGSEGSLDIGRMPLDHDAEQISSGEP
jgi:hypothetical protein